MADPKEYMSIYGSTGLANLIHSLDAQQLNKMPQALKDANEEHGPIIQTCDFCGKKNGGHFIMCPIWRD